MRISRQKTVRSTVLSTNLEPDQIKILLHSMPGKLLINHLYDCTIEETKQDLSLPYRSANTIESTFESELVIGEAQQVLQTAIDYGSMDARKATQWINLGCQLTIRQLVAPTGDTFASVHTS